MASATRRDSSRPVIGVTGNSKTLSPSWFCIRLSVFLNGGRAVRISTEHEVDPASLDGLVISGGDDIHPSLYDADAVPKARYDEARDELEQTHIRHAMRRGLPMLGICRGYQLINVTCGGNLYSDIRDMRKKTSNFNTVLPRKTINLETHSALLRVIGRPQFKVNSLHHQAIDTVAERFAASGHDLDQIVQGIEATDNRRIMGVQWHPEYLFYLPTQRRLFGWLVDQAKRYSGAA